MRIFTEYSNLPAFLSSSMPGTTNDRENVQYNKSKSTIKTKHYIDSKQFKTRELRDKIITLAVYIYVFVGIIKSFKHIIIILVLSVVAFQFNQY